MASYDQDNFYKDDDMSFGGEIDIFNLTFSEAGNVFSVKEIKKILKEFSYFEGYKSINGILIFTLREFPGLVVDILSTNNYIVQLTRQIIHSLNGPRRKPARA
jgi:hypothetical protein